MAGFAEAVLRCQGGLERMKTGWVLLNVLLFALFRPSTSAAQHKDIVGRVEDVRIYPGDFMLRAKLDTGARSCSLNAPHLTRFMQKGEKWVRFTLKNHRGEETTIERKILREAKIKQQGQTLEKRPVVMLGICLGRQYREVEVNLVDRTGFNYQLLIGRNFMIGHIIVDHELKYTADPACVGAPMP
jgi:hypothetical protein